MITVLLAFAAAVAFAAGTVAEHRGATNAAGDPDGGLVRRLVRQRLWLAGQAGAGAGLLLSAAALRTGQLVVVQPVLSSGLVLALVIGVVVDRRHPDRPLPDEAQWTAAVAVALGLSLFLLAARPSAGVDSTPLWVTTVCSGGALACAGIAVLYGRDPRRRHRAFAYGAATGVAFGISGLLLKEVVGSSFRDWGTWAAIAELGIVGGVGILLAQWGFQAGPLVESLPVATVLEPVVAVALAGPLFAEHLASGALERGGQVLGALLLLGGVWVLAWRTARRNLSAASVPEPALGPPALRGRRA